MGSGDRSNNQPLATSSERPIRQPAAADDPFFVAIPETHLPEGWDAPLQNPLPIIVPPPPPPVHRRSRRANQSAAQPMPAPAVVTSVVSTNAVQPMLAPGAQPGAIPETHLPEGWNAPLQNVMPRMMPPPPPPPALRRANRLRQVNQSAAPAPVASTSGSTRSLAGGPLHDIS
ncbi:hypothetical protein C0993_003303, partial [Termitomyces sp. T159_Od127]